MGFLAQQGDPHQLKSIIVSINQLSIVGGHGRGNRRTLARLLITDEYQ